MFYNPITRTILLTSLIIFMIKLISLYSIKNKEGEQLYSNKYIWLNSYKVTCFIMFSLVLFSLILSLFYHEPLILFEFQARILTYLLEMISPKHKIYK